MESESQTNKRAKSKLSSIMDQIINISGLQHIIETVFLNLDYVDLKECQLLNKSCQEILGESLMAVKKY